MAHHRDHDERYEGYLKENRKEDKNLLRIASKTDRSKFKKTDQQKYLKSIEKDQKDKFSKHVRLEGRVISVMPQGIEVEYEGKMISCVLKGLLKKEKTHAKNLVVVGDYVLFEKTSEHEGSISQVKPRKTILSRADNLSRRKEQLIAANVDQVLITISVVNPPIKTPIIDRYIIATQKGGMEPIIVVNKMDLLNSDLYDPILREVEAEIHKDLLAAYVIAGIPVISISTLTGEGLELLKNAMKDRTSVFSGQSGVGKSSLINAVTGLNLRIGGIVEKTKKGSHTTTKAHLVPLEFGGWCVDTPGIKSFGVWDLKKDEIESYFDEIHASGLNCKFTDCTHSHEEQCAVIEDVKTGKISPMRYDSYQALMENIDKTHLRR